MSNDTNRTHGAPSWIQHEGVDPTGSRKFYEKLLGWNITDMPMKNGSTYPAIMVNDKPVGGISPRPDSEGRWLVYITVDDVDATFKAAVKEGARSIAKPEDAPGVGRIATIEDPFGARLAFIKYA